MKFLCIIGESVDGLPSYPGRWKEYYKYYKSPSPVTIRAGVNLDKGIPVSQGDLHRETTRPSLFNLLIADLRLISAIKGCLGLIFK